MAKSGPISPSIFVLIQVIAFLIYAARTLDNYNDSFILQKGFPWMRDYCNWSIAGATIMLAGLIINITHYLAARQKLVLQIGTILVITGMCVVSVGEFYEMNKAREYDATTAQWIMMVAGGALVVYENFAALA